ncbi:ABC transporter substrate-binding protein [Microbacterium sp.]|uniref:ABC transporter substrate-binding protein n=1 Tax=Microbacterium sp. TaxID=51671 RepID=UPI0039E319B3
MRTSPFRRLIPAVAIAALATALVSGCSSSSPTSEESTASSAAAAEGEGVTEYPLTLESPWGETELEAIPERIAVISLTTEDLDSLTALGITPVYAVDSLVDAPWLTEEQATALAETATSSDYDLHLEEVAATEPDLIVTVANTAGGIDQAMYDQLSAIAPVLAYPDEVTEDYSIGWQDSLTIIAEAVDRQNRAKQIIDDVEADFAQARTDHPEFADAAAAFIVNYGAEYGVTFFSATGTNAASVLAELGFQPAPAAGDFVSDSTVSEELFSTIDVDVLFIGENAEEGEHITDNPLFQQLTVSQDKNYVEFSFGTESTNWAAWGLRSSSAQNLPWIIEQLSTGAAEVLAN